MLTASGLQKLRAMVELSANLALVGAVAFGIAVWLRRPDTSLRDTNLSRSSNRNPALGTRVDLPGVDWRVHKATLVLAISSACHYCVSSTPFYSELTRSSHAGSIVVVMPQTEHEAQEFLRLHAINPSSMVSADLASIGVEATPTILLVSPAGVVTNLWVGELAETQRQQVVTALDGN